MRAIYYLIAILISNDFLIEYNLKQLIGVYKQFLSGGRFAVGNNIRILVCVLHSIFYTITLPSSYLYVTENQIHSVRI